MKFSLPRLRRRAFTLLELLIVVVVIGILASLAIIRFGAAQEKAYVATMQSDLRNFATARAIYVSEEAPPASVSDVEGYHFSEFVHELGYRSLSAAEWSLSVGHNKSPTVCTLSALDLNKTHRISCGEAESVTFAATETAPNTVEFDASGAITALAFSADPELLAALAASPADIESVSWNFGDGATASGTPETHTKVSHTYAAFGDYTTTLTLVKKTGEVAKGTKGIKIEHNSAPTASFSYTPTAPKEKDLITFDGGTSSDPENGTLTYAWDFENDGVTDATTAQAQVSYSVAGTYTAKLTVTDPKGLSHSSSQSVVVASAVVNLNKMLVSSYVTGGQWNIFSRNGDGTSPVRLSTADAEDLYPDLSSNGAKIVFARKLTGHSTTQLYVMNSDGSNPVQIWSNTGVYRPKWSPDGSKIVFEHNNDIWVINADGSGAVQITTSTKYDGKPDWSPDGSKIAYASDGDSGPGIYLMNPDGSGKTKVANTGGADGYPSWSPDGSKLVFQGHDGDYEIFMINSDGSGRTQLTHNTAQETEPDWVPDGRIGFGSNRDGPDNIYIMNADGTGVVNLTNGNYHRTPSWR